MIDFGFQITPFGVTPDKRMVFLHKQFSDAYASLSHAIDAGKGFIVITGEVGAGKTTLLRSFLSDEHPSLDTAVVLNTGLDADGLLKAIADDLGIATASGADRKTLIDAMNARLLESFSRGRQTAIFIDEAQNLDLESLEVLRMLSNLETETDKLLQIVLFGQNGLRETLAKPELLQLRSRIAAHRHLKPLDLEETRSYIIHRISAAQPSQPVAFSDAAFKRIHRASKGVPRVINILAGIAVESAAEMDSITIESDHVRIAEEAFKDLEPPPATHPAAATKHALTIVAWILAIIVITLLMLRYKNRAQLGATAPRGAPQAQDVPTSETSKIMELFLTKSGVTLRHDPSVLGTIREDALAAAYGRTWARIPADLKLIEAVGVPALARIGNAGEKNLFVITRSDTPGRFRLERNGGSTDMPMNMVALDTEDVVSILLPIEVQMPYIPLGIKSLAAENLQRGLAKAGCYQGAINGVIDRNAQISIMKFQAENGLPVDGLAGPWTVGAMVSRNLWQSL